MDTWREVERTITRSSFGPGSKRGRISKIAQTAVVSCGFSLGNEKAADSEAGGPRDALFSHLSRAMVAAAVALLLILGTGAAQPAQAQVESVLHSFTGPTSDSANPIAGLIMDSKGNLYGTTFAGGTSTNCGTTGCGTVFELVYDSSTNSYTEKVLYSFAGGTSDGKEPEAGLLLDSKGNLYGTTLSGGATNDGTVFELSPPASGQTAWTEKVLHSFAAYDTSDPAATDAENPFAALIMDSAGNLYGTAEVGGSAERGAVFELAYDSSTHSYTEKVLYSFTGANGWLPFAGLITDSSGNLYGTTNNGGSSSNCGTYGCGIVYELSPPASGQTTWTEKVLYNFTGPDTSNPSASDGWGPAAGLIMDSKGNLYSTTVNGGSSTSCGTNGCGTVFELRPPTTSGGSWTEKLLYSFTGSDGANPNAGLFMDSSGNLYGVTATGGSTYTSASSLGDGTVFELVYDSSTNSYKEKVLQNFTGKNGDYPFLADLIMDSSGNLFSTTDNGGSTYTSSSSAGDGTVFGIAPVKLSASSLSFGSLDVGTTSTAQSVTVTNIGNGNLSYNNVSISGADAADFAITSNTCSAAVAPNGTCSVSVAATPSAASSETASLNLSEAGLTQTVSLTGTGVYPTASFSASSLTFSSQVAGSTSSAQTVTVTNNSAVPLTIKSVSVTGDFAIASNTCKSTVAANGGKCAVGVTFNPTAGGKLTGTLSFTDNATNSPQTVALSGTGEDFSLTASTTSETVAPGGTATYSLQLSPQGGFNQTIDLTCSGPPANSTCTVSPASVTLNGTNNSSVSVKVSTTGSALVAPGPGDFGPPPSGSLPLAAWLAIFGLLGLMGLVKFSPKGGRVRRAAPWATVALAAALFAGCGGGSNTTTTTSNSTPAGTYTLTVKATSGSLSQSTQVTLNVQ